MDTLASLMDQTLKNLPAVWETGVRSLGWDDPLEKEMAAHPVFLPGESQGQRNLEGHSPWGLKESETTKGLTPHFTLRTRVVSQSFCILHSTLCYVLKMYVE